VDLRDPELLALYSAEADEVLGRLEQGIVQLESEPGDAELLSGVFRGAHTLKGNSAALGFVGVAEYCHGLEDVLDRLRGGQTSLTPALATLLLRVVDALRAMLADPASLNSGPSDAQRELLRRLLNRSKAPARLRSRRTARAGTATEDAPKGAPAAVESHGERPDKTAVPRTLRVEKQTLDLLMDLAGEIAISRDRLTGALERLGPAAAEALELHRDADHLYAELQEAVGRARMVPLGPTFQQHIRTVRDLAESRGKSARLLTEGEDVAVDATVIDYLREPLVHMIRNALDHGIERREARMVAGKDVTGTVWLRARRESGQILVEISDDGAGLDRVAILRRARERGLVAEGQELSGPEIDDLVFAPGLSTSAEVTDLSGRGVGLDVVRRSVEAVRGTLEIEGRGGRGTTIRLRLPLTLAIIEGFHVVAGGCGFVIPGEAVVECREAPGEEAAPSGSGLTSRDSRALPYIRLAQLLGGEGAVGARQGLVVVRQGGSHVGLVVDEILGAGPTVVRPLGALFRGVPGISGSTITRSGEIALILDVSELLRQVPGIACEAVA
jgi:two-component system, chemotaxis family, sensor kinase CheA